MSDDHARFAEWDAAYVIGALSPADRREFEAHLDSCERCMRAVAEIASEMPETCSTRDARMCARGNHSGVIRLEAEPARR